jgi:hypothetical protein
MENKTINNDKEREIIYKLVMEGMDSTNKKDFRIVVNSVIKNIK